MAGVGQQSVSKQIQAISACDQLKKSIDKGKFLIHRSPWKALKCRGLGRGSMDAMI
jgi:hypothetical protein